LSVALIEKEATTADVYPLTLNALVNACNQRNNRAPVMALSPREVEAALEPLRLKRLVVLFSGADARVPKFRHTLDTALPMEPVALALMAELLLRGSQTLGELRGRAERLCGMPGVAEVEAVLNGSGRSAGGPSGAAASPATRAKGAAVGPVVDRRTGLAGGFTRAAGRDGRRPSRIRTETRQPGIRGGAVAFGTCPITQGSGWSVRSGRPSLGRPWCIALFIRFTHAPNLSPPLRAAPTHP
jgi:hypothetical protein